MAERQFKQHNFSGADLSYEAFNHCYFEGCEFAGATLRNTDFSDCEFRDCEFNNSDSQQPVDLSYADVQRSLFHHCNLTVAEAPYLKGYGVTFKNCQLQGINLSHADFRMPIAQSDLVDLTIQQCNLSYADLSCTYLSRCTITNSRCIELCLDYTDLTGAVLTDNELHNLRATGVSLKEADLRGSTFNNINPADVDLQGVLLEPEQLFYLVEALGVVVTRRD